MSNQFKVQLWQLGQILGQFWANFESILGPILRPILGTILSPIFGWFRSQFEQFWVWFCAKCGRCWGPILGWFCAVFGMIWGRGLGADYGGFYVGPIWGINSIQFLVWLWADFGANFDLIWDDFLPILRRLWGRLWGRFLPNFGGQFWAILVKFGASMLEVDFWMIWCRFWYDLRPYFGKFWTVFRLFFIQFRGWFCWGQKIMGYSRY
jgi:hypothetical protein